MYPPPPRMFKILNDYIPESMGSRIYYELSCIFYASFAISAPNHVKNLIPRGTFADEELYFYAIHVQDKFTSMQQFIHNCQCLGYAEV